MDGNDIVSFEKRIQSELKDSILLFQPLSHSEDQPLMIVYSSTWQLEQLKKIGGKMGTKVSLNMDLPFMQSW